MKLFIFKTDIDTEQKVSLVNKLFQTDRNIIDISIDIEDVDNVLRLETTDGINEFEIVSRVQNKGFSCVELAD